MYLKVNRFELWVVLATRKMTAANKKILLLTVSKLRQAQKFDG